MDHNKARHLGRGSYQKSLGIVYLLLCLLPGKVAWGKVFFTLQAESFVALGHTSYDTTFAGTDPTYGNYNGESKLEFNLEAYMAGFIGTLSFDGLTRALRVEYAASVAGDGQNFRDRDWVYNDPAYNGTYGTLAGDTTSTGILTPAQFLSLDLQFPLASFGTGNALRLSMGAGFEYRHWGVLDAYNYAGNYYQFFTHAGPQAVDVSSPTPVLSYDITTHSYGAGLNLAADLSADLQASLGVRLGHGDFNDTDVHFLRGRTSTGAGDGLSWSGRGEISWALGGGWALCGEAGLYGLSASGIQTQIYQSLPFTETVNEQVESLQASFGAGLSFTP